MLSARQPLSRRLHIAIRKAYLQYRLREARKDANVIEAEMLAALRELIVIRSFITDTVAKLEALEVTR